MLATEESLVTLIQFMLVSDPTYYAGQHFPFVIVLGKYISCQFWYLQPFWFAYVLAGFRNYSIIRPPELRITLFMTTAANWQWSNVEC